MTLQQILMLKYIGFGLDEIKKMLTDPKFDISQALVTQRAVLSQRTEELKGIVAAIDEALTGKSEDWNRFAVIIRAMHMEKGEDLTKKYYSAEAKAKLDERMKSYTPEMAQRDAGRWSEVMSEARKLYEAKADPAGAEAQAVSARWQGLADEFTMGDLGITQGLSKVYADRKKMPQFYGKFDPDFDAFCQKMRAVYQTKQGQKGC